MTSDQDQDTTTERTRAMFNMLDTAEDVARLMAGVKQQFITEGGYSPDNAEECALLLWRSGLQADLMAAGQPARSEQLARAQEWIANVQGAARQLLATLQPSAQGWQVQSQVAFTTAVDGLLLHTGINADTAR